MRNWSAQQELIFQWFSTGIGHLLVRALAGTGKTTTIIEGVKRAPERNILICAFSKIIQVELDRRINPKDSLKKLTHIIAKTLHSVGLSCIRKFRSGITVDFSSAREEAITDAVCGPKVPDEIKRLVTKLHTKGREIAPHARELGDLTDIAVQFECEPNEEWANSGFPLEQVETFALEAMEWASNIQNDTIIDGSDMIFLPVRNHWLIPMHDLVVVDEAQDMTPAQLEIALGVLKPGGRVCVVGDENQAIFGFRGADSEALDRLKTLLGAAELGLTVTYRCGRAIVEEAQRFVPHYEAAPTNSDGEITFLQESELVMAVQPGDYVLSRVNAPLIGYALKMLVAGKRTRIAGQDIGKGLIALVRKMRARSVEDFINRVTVWEAQQLTRLQNTLDNLPAATRKRRAPALISKMGDVSDRAGMLVSLTEDATSMAMIEARITNLFKDDGLGVEGMITCSSVHKAKGLEANRVFILQDTLRDYNQEERNITYVAITRAKDTLTWVHP